MKEQKYVIGSQEFDTLSQELGIAFLTGRVVQFIEDIAESHDIPAGMLASRISTALGSGESRHTFRFKKGVPTLRKASTKTRSTARKVEVHRRTRGKLSPQALRWAKEALKKGASVNSIAKKYHIGWVEANQIKKAA